jgi:hypothetical protein
LPGSSDTAYVVNGGTANVKLGETCGTLPLGGAAGSGMAQMTGGNLTGEPEYIGNSATGNFYQTSGTNNASWLYLGANSGRSGNEVYVTADAAPGDCRKFYFRKSIWGRSTRRPNSLLRKQIRTLL